LNSDVGAQGLGPGEPDVHMDFIDKGWEALSEFCRKMLSLAVLRITIV
jgi:hypothetical protein